MKSEDKSLQNEQKEFGNKQTHTLYCALALTHDKASTSFLLESPRTGTTIGFQLFSNRDLGDSTMLTCSLIPPGWYRRINSTLTAVITGYTSPPTNYCTTFWLVCHCKHEPRKSVWAITRGRVWERTHNKVCDTCQKGGVHVKVMRKTNHLFPLRSIRVNNGVWQYAFLATKAMHASKSSFLNGRIKTSTQLKGQHHDEIWKLHLAFAFWVSLRKQYEQMTSYPLLVILPEMICHPATLDPAV